MAHVTEPMKLGNLSKLEFASRAESIHGMPILVRLRAISSCKTFVCDPILSDLRPGYLR